MKETGEDMDALSSERNGDVPVISSSAEALQQAELKKDILHSLIGPKSQSRIKSVLHVCLFHFPAVSLLSV